MSFYFCSNLFWYFWTLLSYSLSLSRAKIHCLRRRQQQQQQKYNTLRHYFIPSPMWMCFVHLWHMYEYERTFKLINKSTTTAMELLTIRLCYIQPHILTLCLSSLFSTRNNFTWTMLSTASKSNSKVSNLIFFQFMCYCENFTCATRVSKG